jgi:TPR repeat protein
VKRIYELPVLVTILALAWLPIVQAQQSDTPKVEGIAVADLEQLRTLSQDGDPEAQYQLAEVYRIGFPVEQDTAKAIELYKRSAGQGYAASQFRLGDLYEEGGVLERDLGKAVESYRKAADQGHSGAQYALAHIYHLGSGVTQDMAAAMVWYRKAALQGDEWSQLALGDQYRIGLAVPRDLAQSTKWYRRSAERGNIFAQFELGNAYRFGNGVERDATQAMVWYRLSAEAGNPSAKLALAELETGAAAVAMASAPVSEAAPSAPASDAADPGDPGAPGAPAAELTSELAYAAAPSYSDEEEVSLLLAHARDQVANLALTTPEGDNAYETYRLILSLRPNNQAALIGIEQIGVEYANLTELAAARGDHLKARRYAEKAAELAPENPYVQSMTIPIEETQPAFEDPIPTSETSEIVETPPQDLVEPQEASAEIEEAPVVSASVTPNSPAQDVDDLIFRPHSYNGRQVVVTGAVVHLLWDYRLKAETGQNSIAIDVDGLSPANRARLESAIEGAGFLGQVRARIRGTVRRQTPATFELAASELTLIETVPTRGAALNPDPDPDLDEATPRVDPVDPGAPLVQTNGHVSPGDSTAASARYQPAPGYVPACYQDAVWRRLSDGRIQTGTRTRCY